MSLAEQIIDSGPYAEGDTIRAWMLPPNLTAAALNALRDELIEYRQLRAAAEAEHASKWRCNRTERCFREDGHHGPHAYPGTPPGPDAVAIPLAELVRRAGEHTEDCT